MSRTRRRSSRAPATVVLLLFVAAGIVFAVRTGRTLPRAEEARPDHAESSALVTAPVSPAPPRPHSLVTAQLYFLRIVNGKERMMPVAREVPRAAPAKAALNELIAGKLPPGCARPLPAGVSVRGVKIAHGIVTADFSRELVSSFRGGSDSEGVTVYAIVNTLTSLPGVKKARILVEGEPVDTIGGHLDVSGPLTADSELVISRR